MQLIKALIGGLIGGALGAGAHLWAEMSVGRSLPWLLVLAGLGAGLGVRLLLGAHGRNLLTGIIAAAMSFVGIISATTASSYVAMQAASQPVEIAERLDDENDEPSAEDGDIEAVETVITTRRLPESMASDAVDRYGKANSWPIIDVVINSLSALIAYGLGAGLPGGRASNQPLGDAGSEAARPEENESTDSNDQA